MENTTTARAVQNRTTRAAALTAGISLLVMAAAAIFGYGIIHPQIVVPGDSQATAQLIASNAGLYRLELAVWLLILITDILVAWAIAVFFSPHNKALAVTTASFRLVYAAILAAAIYSMATAPGSTDPLSNFDRFETIWSAGLVVFGVHITLLAVLTAKSGIVPKVLVWFLYIAGPSYFIVHGIPFAFATAAAAKVADTLNMILALPMTVAELGLAVWLIAKGGKQRSF